MGDLFLARCAYCRNPHCGLWRTQCRFEGEGEKPCAEADRLQRERIDRHWMIAALAVLGVLLLAVLALLFRPAWPV